MKNQILFLTLITLFITGSTVSAHPGNTSWDGCHYCRTNCAKWGYTTGTRHCHNGGTPQFGPADPLHYSKTTTTKIQTTINPVKPQCGSSNGGSFSIKPSINLCSTGSTSIVSGNTSWTWTCALGELSIKCSAKKTTPTPTTQSKCGKNQYLGSDNKCYCSTGYTPNQSKTECVSNTTCTIETLNNPTICNEENLMKLLSSLSSNTSSNQSGCQPGFLFNPITGKSCKTK